VKAYGIAPDPVMARSWYEKAKEFGSPDAQQRLEQLQR
jgi:TPR repeat protein